MVGYFKQYSDAKGFFKEYGGSFIPPDLQKELSHLLIEFSISSNLCFAKPAMATM
jgi:hypothetical protein